ncbi:hypothetical protein G943_02510 [Escherichia coli UMEA 3212-1]|nr:hypothetical protein G854_02581 [Escherichia coli HVH 202 (4-3163997)]EQY20611.1 hypothetical protein G943_02510 [Escherichia coli UMEA 3212-1]
MRCAGSISRFLAHVVGCVEGVPTTQITLLTSRKYGIVGDAFKFNICLLATLCGRLCFIRKQHISFVV